MELTNVYLNNKKCKDINISENNINVFVCEDDKLIRNLLLQISGINESNIRYLNSLVFDNEEYFLERLYLEKNFRYFSSLNTKRIEKELLDSYQKIIDIKKFRSLLERSRVYLKYQKGQASSTRLINTYLLLSYPYLKIMPSMFDDLEDEDASIICDGLEDVTSLITSCFFESLRYVNKNYDIYFVYEDNTNVNITKVTDEVYYTDYALTSEFKDYIIYKLNNLTFLSNDIFQNKELSKKISIKKMSIGADYEK